MPKQEFEFRHLSFRLPKPPLYASLLNVLDQRTTSSAQELEYCADCSLPWQSPPNPGGKLGSVHDMQICAQGDGRLILYTPALPYHGWPGEGGGALLTSLQERCSWLVWVIKGPSLEVMALPRA